MVAKRKDIHSRKTFRRTKKKNKESKMPEISGNKREGRQKNQVHTARLGKIRKDAELGQEAKRLEELLTRGQNQRRVKEKSKEEGAGGVKKHQIPKEKNG